MPHPLLLITTELAVGGAEKALTEIALRLPALGFSPTIVCLKPRPATGRDRLVVRLEEARLPVRFLDLKRFTQLWRGVGELRRIIDEKQASVALSFMFHANVLTALATAKRKKAKHFASIRVAEPSWWRNKVEAWALRDADGVICVSQAVKNHFARYCKHPERLSVICNGIEPMEKVAPIDLSRLGVATSDKVILFLGRLHPQKGLDWAIPQVGDLLVRRSDAHFVVAGDGPEQERLERLGVGQPWAERIHFLGFQADPQPLLARAHCLLLPSRWEGMPNVILEAMSAGLPVLASEESSARELLRADEADAQLFFMCDSDSFSTKLDRILSDETLAAQLRAANLTASRDFTWQKTAEAFAARLK